MADSVLYFPSIRVPEGEWFTRVLLYWDSVGTIVPLEYLDDPKFLRPYTAGLIEHDLLKPVLPDDSIWSVGARKYLEAFLGLIDSDPVINTGRPLNERDTIRIHADKTGTGLASNLCERKLARHLAGPEWASWFEVEKRTGSLLMAYLAAVLGQGKGMTPITDAKESITLFATIPVGDTDIVARKDPVRTEILPDILPAPVDPIPPGDLRKFKDDHHDQLASFRNAVEGFVIEAAAIGDVRLRRDRIERKRSEWSKEIQDISGRMQERMRRRIGLGSLLAVATGGVVAADAVVSGGMLTYAGASLGLASAVYTAFDGARTPKQLLDRPMAYAALAHRRWPLWQPTR